jgi:peptidoglycan/LPS O-acetylase OafA/YrhL
MKNTRVRSLDGLRAVSILMVIAGHANLAVIPQHPWMRRFIQLSSTDAVNGVFIFFAISGFIITALLIRERRQTGRISLGGFYIRRAFRILPPLWCFLVAMAVFGPPAPARSFLRAFAFLTDYLPAETWTAGHTWSLSVEEKFYLIWPVLFLVAGRRGGRYVLFAALAVAPLLRVFQPIESGHALGSEFHLLFDAMAIGCLLAVLLDEEPDHWVVRFLRHDITAFTAVMLLLWVIALEPRLSRMTGTKLLWIATSLRALSSGSLIAWALANKNHIFTRLLNTRVMVHIGLISYSLYLWQQPFFQSLSDQNPFARLWPLRIAGAFAAAELSFWLIEKPALALRIRVVSGRAADASVAGGTSLP